MDKSIADELHMLVWVGPWCLSRLTFGLLSGLVSS